MSDPQLLLGVVAIPLLLLVSAAFVAAEIALVTVRPTELDELARAGSRGAAPARAVVARIDRALAAIQVGITSIGLLLGWFAESTIAEQLRPLAARALPGWPGAVPHLLAGALILGLLTGVQVVLAELVPKAIALHHPRRAALLLARPLLLFSRAAAPVVWLLNGAATAVLALLGLGRAARRSRVHSVHELALLVEETRRAGALRPEQAEVVHNVFRMSERRAEDVMVPLERVAMLDVGWPAERVLAALEAGAHTRLPVYEGERTRVIGLVNAKDVFRLWRRTGATPLREVLRPAACIPPGARVAEQLPRFRARRLHMALVQEGERPLGIVTLEDIIEEVVGEIEDEHDRPAGGAGPTPRGGEGGAP